MHTIFERGAEDKGKAGVAVTVAPALPSVSTPEQREAFWREVIRVNFDKAILLVLAILLHHWHAPDNMQAVAIGGLIVLIQGQRFRLSINRN